MKNICKTCVWSRVTPRRMEKNEGCKNCKHHTKITRLCQSCVQIVKTEIPCGLETQHKRAEWADYE